MDDQELQGYVLSGYVLSGYFELVKWEATLYLSSSGTTKSYDDKVDWQLVGLYGDGLPLHNSLTLGKYFWDGSRIATI
jgi:hypothetical protein